MLIKDMTREESLDFLARARPARLACSRKGQPYVMPIHLARDGDRFYGFATAGQKIDWMRENPLVCVEADEVESMENWRSVVAFGRFSELLKTPPHEAERRHAHALLWRNSEPWESGYARTIVHGKAEALEPVDFRIDVGEVSGRHAVPGIAK